MTAEQTVFVGDDLKVVINVIDANGSHAAATVDTGTTRVEGYAAIPTVNTIGTGIYEIVFTGLTPAPANKDRLIVKVNGSVDGGSAWTEYAIPVKVVAQFDNTADEVTTDTASRDASKADTSDIPKKDTTYRYTNTLGGTDDVSIGDVP